MSIVPDNEPAQSDPAHIGHAETDQPLADPLSPESNLVAYSQPDPPMVTHTRAGETEPDHTRASHTEADHTMANESADAMKDQLRKDVASWREARSDGSSRAAADLSVAVARSIVPPTTARMKRARPAAPEAKPATTEKKPFGMSYDGTSRADYIKLMISRGAR